MIEVQRKRGEGSLQRKKKMIMMMTISSQNMVMMTKIMMIWM
jgi:hypothetical protein